MGDSTLHWATDLWIMNNPRLASTENPMDLLPPTTPSPTQADMYLAQEEHDACGIGMIAQLQGQASHGLVQRAITILENMEHRGARGYDRNVGDGAGILIRIPDLFFRNWARKFDVLLPPAGTYAVGVLALSRDKLQQLEQMEFVRKTLEARDFEFLGIREVPVQEDKIGEDALLYAPAYLQLLVKFRQPADSEALERKLYVLRNALERTWAVLDCLPQQKPFVVSFSSRTLIYKGMLGTDQLKHYFPDLSHPDVQSCLALVHSRFSTNTFPSWSLAQPFRFIAHNGEINTIRANVIWMKAREAVLNSSLFSTEELALLHPICDPNSSDSRNLDRAVELLLMSGRTLPQVLAMLMPMAWESDTSLSPEVRAFYEFHSLLIEPWDGPASVCFTDGRMVGACLDRNGLRPSRFCITHDQHLILASEAGILNLPDEEVQERGRLQPGSFLVAELGQGIILRDDAVKATFSGKQPYVEWLGKHRKSWQELPQVAPTPLPDPDILHFRHLLFGIDREDLRTVLAPMAGQGSEPIGSMGTDTPLAILSQKPQHLANYFKQLFAQVSNPPIDPIREAAVMSLRTWLGPGKNLLEETEAQARHLPLPHPVLSIEQLSRLEAWEDPDYRSIRISTCMTQGQSLKDALDFVVRQVREAVMQQKASLIILSDRESSEFLVPIPMLLALGTVHQALIRAGKRPRVDLLVDTADVLEVHHFATLIAYGATAICPYHALETLSSWAENHMDFRDRSEADLHKSYVYAVTAGLKKVMSKMGISTIPSYHGAQIFEIVGLSKEVVDLGFAGTISRLGGLSLEGLEKEIRARHSYACQNRDDSVLPSGGNYQWRLEGERHAWDPQTIHLLQKSARLNDQRLYRQYADRVNDTSTQPLSIRHLFDIVPLGSRIPIEEVEPVESILRRFATGAMSFGSISHEAHSTLAIAMNRIGGKSNSGEGGEDPARFFRKENGDWERSAIKQIASGRFGVTAEYLSQADELQIKIAQGAKPGEGGQLPGHKVDDWIGRVRHSTPGVGLISPPPHHDIYSIEDLAQLIYDLHHINPKARVSVKLVSKAGVGTIAAGVAKGGADHILISGYDGGTGASPLSSIRHAGLPWEMGLAEAHQTLVKNRLRDRVTIQADGGMRTGRDLAIATLLGAEEWAIATAALVVEGCILMRKCHLNTCPVGIATQDEELRKRFAGKAEDLIHFFTFLAEDLREHMAALGYRRVEEMVGQAQHLRPLQVPVHEKAASLDLSALLVSRPLAPQKEASAFVFSSFEQELIREAQPALEEGETVHIQRLVRNTDRTVGAQLSYEITRRYGAQGLPMGSILLDFRGTAGQSFGAFASRGMDFRLRGEANDYVGKGLSGGRIVISPDRVHDPKREPEVIAGNVVLYGATSGELFLAGKAGERFAVRNSGAVAVVEGIGDHGCEYMTGGMVVILGEIGKNFAAGMSGGLAYVFDPENRLTGRMGSQDVDMDPLEAADLSSLYSLLLQHHSFTHSPVAEKILSRWEVQALYFKKVIPSDFKRILQRKHVAAMGPPSSKLIG